MSILYVKGKLNYYHDYIEIVWILTFLSNFRSYAINWYVYLPLSGKPVV